MSQVGAGSKCTGKGDTGTSFRDMGLAAAATGCSSKFYTFSDFPGGARGEEPACRCRRHKTPRFHPWVGNIPWRRKWQPTPVFLPGDSQEESGGQQFIALQRVGHD